MIKAIIVYLLIGIQLRKVHLQAHFARPNKMIAVSTSDN